MSPPFYLSGVSMSSYEAESIEERLDRVERESRRCQAAGLGVGIGGLGLALCVMFVSSTPKHSPVTPLPVAPRVEAPPQRQFDELQAGLLRVHRLELLDQRGKIVATLGVDEKTGTSLQMYDQGKG